MAPEIIDETFGQRARADRFPQTLRRKAGQRHEALKLVDVGGKPCEAGIANGQKFFGIDPIAQSVRLSLFLVS